MQKRVLGENKAAPKKMVAISLVFALMGESQGKFFLFSFDC